MGWGVGGLTIEHCKTVQLLCYKFLLHTSLSSDGLDMFSLLSVSDSSLTSSLMTHFIRALYGCKLV